jgi:hypothetical protein
VEYILERQGSKPCCKRECPSNIAHENITANCDSEDVVGKPSYLRCPRYRPFSKDRVL